MFSSVRGRIALAVVFCVVASLPVFAQTFHFDQASYTTHEGDGQMTIRIVRDPGTTSPASAFVTTSCCSGTASYGSDYWIAGSQFNSFVTIPFAAGEMFKDVTIVIGEDTIGEGTEIAQLALSGPSSFPDATSIAILDNDAFSTFAFDTSQYTVNEHDGTVSVGVTRGSDLSNAGTVQYSTHSNTAFDGSDFQTTTGTLSFAAGEAHKTITIPIVDDAVAEPTEVFTVILSNATGGTLAFPNNTSVTIVDDDATARTVGFSSSQYFANESEGSATITVRRTGSTTGATTVQYETSSSCCVSATPVADYTPVAGTLTFAAGEITKTFTIPIVNDTIDESTETVSLRLANATGATLDNTVATLSIIDDDASTSTGFAQLNVGVGEGNGPAVLTVVRSGELNKTTVVTYTTFDGTARNATDYGLTAGSITFAPGETTKTITVPITNDTVPEPSETFAVQISDSFNSSVAQVTIFDDDGDLPFVTFSQPAYTVREDAGTLQVTVQRTGNPSAAFSVDYTNCNFCFFSGGFATVDFDYLPFAGTLSFAPGEMSKTIVIKILQDSIQESSEGFGVSLSNALGATIASSQASVTIIDDDFDANAAYSLDPPAVIVGEGATSVTLTAVRSDASKAESLRLSAFTISAINGIDFVSANSAIQFAPGESRKAFTISIIDDSIAEADEQFGVQLISASNALLGSATVTIRDNDAVSFSVQPVRVVEGDSGTRAAVFTVTPTGALSGNAALNYNTVDETATAGSDYLPVNGTLSWLAGDMTPRTISVIVNGDTTPEDDETFLLKLASGVVVRGTIANDDAALSITGNPSVKEGNDGTTNATFTVTLSPAQTSPVTVGYATTGGSASESDYVPAGAVLTFAPGETQKTINIAVNGDTIPESNETFGIRLTTATGAGILHGNATATILDDDDPFTVTRDIEYAFADGVSLKLDLYTPNGTSGPHPLVLWIHGDQWTDGTRFPSPAVREAMRGYAVASIDIRSTNVDIFPAQINDAKAAVRFLRANAARFELDPSRFAAWGFGSGGHIASLLGTSGDVDALSDPAEGNPAFSSRVQAVVSWAAPYDLLQLQNDALACSTTNHNSSGSYVSIFLGCPLEFCGQKAWDASPGKYAGKDDPPFLIIHGQDDCEIGPAQATSFARLLRSAKVDVTLKTYPVLGHTVPSINEPADALSEVDRFLDAKLAAPGRRRPTMH